MDLTKLIDEVYESSEETKREENAKVIAAEITRGGHKLVEVVEELGPRLTSTVVQDRVVGMSLLGHILRNLKPDFLNALELTFIVEFLHDRLKDQHLVIPKVIICILPVVQCSNLPEGSSIKLLRQLFQEANIQSHTQLHRRAFFLILQHLIRDKISEIKELGSDFVMSFLQAMDGEKDPRNLLILFNFIPIILANFPLGPFVEDFFEVLSMYFPIDFNPMLGGPDAEVTTRNELAKSLHICLSQTNQFSTHLVPLALEKLESSVVDAKLDSLNLLEMCCERSYTAEDLGPHLPPIWHALRREIFMGGNEEVEKAANSFIRAAFKRVSENEEILETALKLIFTECKHHLSEPELRLSQPACKILCSAAAGSKISCSRVISITLPLLFDQFTTKTSNPERRGILGIMIIMMSAIRPFPSLTLSALLGNWDEILWMWFSLLTHSHDQFVLLSLLAFLSLLDNGKERKKSIGEEYQYPDFDEKNRDLLQAHLLSLLSKDEILPEITSRVVSLIGMLAQEFPTEFLRTSAPKLMSFIEMANPNPTSSNASGSDEGNNEISEEKMKNHLDALALCSSSLPVGKVVIPALVKVIGDLKERKEDYEALVGCLATIIDEVSVGPEGKSFVDFVSSHLEELIRVGIDARSNEKSILYARLVGIVRTIIKNSDASRQQELVDSFWNKRVGEMESGDVALTEVVPGLLGEGILGSVRPSTHIAKKEELMKLLLEKVFSGSLMKENGGFEMAGGDAGKETPKTLDALANIRLFATFLNKAEENEFTALLEQVETLLDEKLQIPAEDSTRPFEVDGERVSPAEEALTLNVRSNDTVGVTFFIWTVKALAMRGYPDLHIWIENKMIRLLNNSLYGHLVADGFSALMSDSPTSLNSSSFCNYRFLYKQRIFQLSIPHLVKGYKAANGETKPNFIKALTGQLRHVPQVVLQMELNNVVPLLVGSLDYELPSGDEKESVIISRNAPNAPLLFSSLTALLELLTPSGNPSSGEEKTTPVLDYFLDITPRLIRLAQYKGFMQVRILALKCLQRCARLPATHVVLPIKEQIVRDLQICLDDQKRLVRKEAVLCRNIWTLTGSPGGI